MIEYTTPCLLSKVINDIGAGAFLKSIENDRKAIVVDPQGDNNRVIVCMAKNFADNKEPVYTSDYYYLTEIAETSEWIALTIGGDLLIED